MLELAIDNNNPMTEATLILGTFATSLIVSSHDERAEEGIRRSKSFINRCELVLHHYRLQCLARALRKGNRSK